MKIERDHWILTDLQLSTHAAWGCWGLGSAEVLRYYPRPPLPPPLSGDFLHLDSEESHRREIFGAKKQRENVKADIPGGLISVATARALKR